MKLVWNLALTLGVMVLLLFAAGLLGGIGEVELLVWAVLLVAALTVVGWRSRTRASG
jgi:hypothetical protein